MSTDNDEERFTRIPLSKRQLVLLGTAVACFLFGVIVGIPVGRGCAPDSGMHPPAVQAQAPAVHLAVPARVAEAAPVRDAPPKPQDLNARTIEERAKQGTMLKEHGVSYVLDVYRAKLAQAPDDPVLLYLVARHIEDSSEALKMCSKAASMAPQYAWAYHCMSFQYQDLRDGAKALETARTAARYSTATDIQDNYNGLAMDWYPYSLVDSLNASVVKSHVHYCPETVRLSFSNARKGAGCVADWGQEGKGKVCIDVAVNGESRCPDGRAPLYFCTTTAIDFFDDVGGEISDDSKLDCKHSPYSDKMLLKVARGRTVARVVVFPDDL